MKNFGPPHPLEKNPGKGGCHGVRGSLSGNTGGWSDLIPPYPFSGNPQNNLTVRDSYKALPARMKEGVSYKTPPGIGRDGTPPPFEN